METEALPQEEEKQVEEKNEKTDLYHNPEALWRIAGWSRVISWIILAVVLVAVGLNVYQFVQYVVASKPAYNIQITNSILSMLFNLSFGVFFFLVLQAVAEGIYILLDIEENTRPKTVK